jgi:hypothetical protein
MKYGIAICINCVKRKGDYRGMVRVNYKTRYKETNDRAKRGRNSQQQLARRFAPRNSLRSFFNFENSGVVQ